MKSEKATQILLLAAGLVFFLVGIFRGEAAVVLSKTDFSRQQHRAEARHRHRLFSDNPRQQGFSGLGVLRLLPQAARLQQRPGYPQIRVGRRVAVQQCRSALRNASVVRLSTSCTAPSRTCSSSCASWENAMFLAWISSAELSRFTEWSLMRSKSLMVWSRVFTLWLSAWFSSRLDSLTR